MFHTITVSNAEWAHLFFLFDLAPDDKRKQLQDTGGHILHRGDEKGGSPTIVPGEQSTYGRIRPWGDLSPDRGAFREHWERKGANGEDYYIALSHKSPPGFVGDRFLIDNGGIGMAYPERMFAWGEDEDGNQLARSEVVQYLAAAGLRHSSPDFWDPVTIHQGYNRGYPTFNNAVRGHTDLGPRWWDWKRVADGKLPDGYDWDQQPDCQFGNLYIELEEELV